MKTKTRRGYSLIEISVAIAIIVVLFAMLFGLWGTISRRTKTVTCVSNLRQIMTAISNYAAAHEQRLPFISPDPFWADRITPYLSSPGVFRCPEGIANMDFYASIDTSEFYDGKKPTTDVATSQVFTNTGTVGFFSIRDPSNLASFQALKTDGTFTSPIYLIFANPIASPKMQEKYSVWKTFFDWGACINSCGGTCYGKTQNDSKDSQYRVVLSRYNPSSSSTITQTVIPDLRQWAVRDGGTIVVGPYHDATNGLRGIDFEFIYQAIDPLAGIPMGTGGTQLRDHDAHNFVTPPTTFTYYLLPKPPGVNMNPPYTNSAIGVWVWNEFINPSQIQVRTMWHHDNGTIAPYFSYRFDVIVSDKPKLPEWYVPGAVPVTGTVSDVGSLEGQTPVNSYGANNLAGNVRKGFPFYTGEIAADTILLVDYGTVTVNWKATDVSGIGNNVTITADPTPPVAKRHIGGKISVLKADGSVETIDPTLIPRGWWTPRAGD